MCGFQIHTQYYIHTPVMYPNSIKYYTHILCALFGYIMGVCCTMFVFEIHFQFDHLVCVHMCVCIY